MNNPLIKSSNFVVHRGVEEVGDKRDRKK
jgi:hypothetical protein